MMRNSVEIFLQKQCLWHFTGLPWDRVCLTCKSLFKFNTDSIHWNTRKLCCRGNHRV